MKLLKLKIWLSKRSKRLDKKFTKQFWDWNKKETEKLINSIDISTKDIKVIKKL